MANVARIRGFVASKSLIGGDTGNPLIREYNADAARTNGIYIGDPVTLEADGNVAQAASGETILGVVAAVGVESTNFGDTGYWDADNLGKRYLASTDVGVVGVIPAEMYLFTVYDDVDNDLVQGSFADLAVAQGSATTGNSAFTIDGAVTTNTDTQVVEQVTTPDNDPTLADARYMIKFQHTQNALD